MMYDGCKWMIGSVYELNSQSMLTRAVFHIDYRSTLLRHGVVCHNWHFIFVDGKSGSFLPQKRLLSFMKSRFLNIQEPLFFQR